jgi:hypothetical protein
MPAPLAAPRTDDLHDLPLRVALIDGAVDLNHPALAGARVEVLNDGAPLNAVCHSPNSPSCLHGTFIAGLILGAQPNKPLRPASAPTLLLRPIFCQAEQLQQCPLVDEQELAKALHQCLDARARIINMSLGVEHLQGAPGPELTAAYQRAEREGVLLIAAAGNQGSELVNPLFRHPWVLPVTAHDTAGRILPSANQGPWLAEHGLSAPGDALQGPVSGGGWGHMSGTSAAAAWVTGQAATLWTTNPSATASEVRQTLLARAHRMPARAIPLLTDPFQSGALPASITMDNTLLQASESLAEVAVQPQACSCQSADASDSPQYIYAIGALRPVFPSLDVQKEFEAQAQVLGLSEQDFYGVFTATNGSNYYLAQQTRWVLSVNNVDTYLVIPRSELELDDFINTLDPSQTSGLTGELMTLIVGQRGPMSPPGYCGTLELPMVVCSQVYYFTDDDLLKQLTSDSIEVTAVRDVLKSLEFKPNDGASAASRAVNYIAVRYPEVYRKTSTLKQGSAPTASNADKQFLAGVSTQPSAVQSDRSLIDVIFKYQSNRTGEQYFYYCCIDVSGLFPFLNTPLRSYVPVGA